MRLKLVVVLVVASCMASASAFAQFGGLKKFGAAAKDKVTGADSAKDQDKKDGPATYTDQRSFDATFDAVNTWMNRSNYRVTKSDKSGGVIETEVTGGPRTYEYAKIQIDRQDAQSKVEVSWMSGKSGIMANSHNSKDDAMKNMKPDHAKSAELAERIQRGTSAVVTTDRQ